MAKFLKSRQVRSMRVRAALRRNASGRLRLSVFRSLKQIYAQIIDDSEGRTLVSASTLEKDIRASLDAKSGTVEAARAVGVRVAEKALKQGIKEIVFDRGGYMFHGRVKALADGARETGLKF